MSDCCNTKAVIFDLGGVLMDVHMERIPPKLTEMMGGSGEDPGDYFWIDEVFHKLERGQIGIEEYHAHFCRKLGCAIDLETFLSIWNDIFDGFVDGMDDLARAISSKYTTVVLSNTNIAHTEEWSRIYADFLTIFDRIFVSHDIDSRKPEPEAFQVVLDYLQLEPCQTVFLDDMAMNVEAAQAMGIKGVVVHDVQQVTADLRQLGVEL